MAIFNSYVGLPEGKQVHIFLEWIQVRCDISHMSLVVYGQFFFQLHPGRVFTSDGRAAEALAPLAASLHGLHGRIFRISKQRWVGKLEPNESSIFAEMVGLWRFLYQLVSCRRNQCLTAC